MSSNTADAKTGQRARTLGLRPFEEEDRPFFCGRRTHTAEVLHRLAATKFVAVVGLSGSGKSSLVRAGVIPELRADRLKNSSSEWVIAITTPETTPLERLAAALVSAVSEDAADNRVDLEKIESSANEVPAVVGAGSWV